MLLPIYVLSNTGLDDKIEQIQVIINKKESTRMRNMMTMLLNI